MSDMENKKIVHAEKISLEEAVPGMVLAEAVKNEVGGVILSEDSVLSRDSIDKLKRIGILNIFIEKCVIKKQDDILRDRKAVVIADSLFFRHMFSKMLYRLNMFVCDEVEDINRGIGEVARHKPELVVIDIDLPPGTSGVELIRNYRKRLPLARIVAVSASKEKETIVESIRAGANDFMMKPVIWEMFRPRLIKLFDPDADVASDSQIH